MTKMAKHRIVHADRMGIDPWFLIGIAIASAVLGGVAGQVVGARLAGSPNAGALVGGALALVGVLALQSVSVRLVSRVVMAVTALALVRLAVLSGSLLAGGQVILVWVIAAIVMLVLTDRVATDAQPGMAGPASAPAVAGDRSRLARNALTVVVLVVVAALVVTPFVSNHLARSATAGQGPELAAQDGRASVLRASDRLDMTTRPRNTDAVVFTVAASRATFWRGQTYDQWDGRIWSQSLPQRFRLGGGDTVVHDRDDLGATGTDEVVQRFRFEASYSDVVFAAASAVKVESRRDVLQREDGTVLTAGLAFGRDATYTVTSRRPVLSEARLRSLNGPVPPVISTRFAAPPKSTERVRSAAVAATSGATTTYDKVRALEAWMGARTSYSLDAPLSPTGVDVVDHFLFETRQGWCEQVASSLVVLARANQIPARLVTGYVPGELDRVTGTFTVRERDAHAWAEVWFPEVGWVPFDPTAKVPLAGEDTAEVSIGRWLLGHAVVVLLALATVIAVGFTIAMLIRRVRQRRADRPVGWAAEVDSRLVRLGRRAEWPRSDAETASAFAASLGRHLGDPRVADVGLAVDQALYSPTPPGAADRARIEVLLDSLFDSPVPPTMREVERAEP